MSRMRGENCRPLRELNRSGRTTVPDDATAEAATSFVPTRWRGYLESTRGQCIAAQGQCHPHDPA